MYQAEEKQHTEVVQHFAQIIFGEFKMEKGEKDVLQITASHSKVPLRL